MEELESVEAVKDDFEFGLSSGEDNEETELSNQTDGTDSDVVGGYNSDRGSGSSSVAASVDLSFLIDENLGGVPVVLVNDVSEISSVSTYALSANNSYQLPEYYVNYFSGVLDNIGNTDYVAYATRIYSSSYNYEEHYYLIYDVLVENDVYVPGSYPYIEVFRSSNGTYSLLEGTDTLTSIPSFAYGSFGHLSDLRKGGSYEVSLATLFAICVIIFYFICTHIYDFVMSLRKGYGSR